MVDLGFDNIYSTCVKIGVQWTEERERKSERFEQIQPSLRDINWTRPSQKDGKQSGPDSARRMENKLVPDYARRMENGSTCNP